MFNRLKNSFGCFVDVTLIVALIILYFKLPDPISDILRALLYASIVGLIASLFFYFGNFFEEKEDMGSKLKELQKLKKKKLITEEEYLDQRKKVLSDYDQ